MIDLLFVYGSLMDSQNEFGLYLQQNADFVEEGFFKGRLYDTGEYPAALLDAEGYKIIGKVYRLSNIEKNLAVLDDYEGYGENQLQPNLFVRELISIETSKGFLQCWTYLYNWPVDKLVEISTGNYKAYISGK